MKQILFSYLCISFLASCVMFDHGDIKITTAIKTNVLNFSISNIQLNAQQFTFSGANLGSVTSILVKEGASQYPLLIESKSATSIVSNSQANLILAAGKVFEFIISSAAASSTFTINFSLCDSTLGGKFFDCLVTPIHKDVLAYDSVSDKWVPSNPNGTVVNVTTTPYNVNASQNGEIITYNGVINSVVNLPALSTLPNTWSIIISRQAAKSVTIQLNGTDQLPGGSGSIEMRGRNIQSIKLMKLGTKWSIAHLTPDCVIGNECWTSDNTGGMKSIYAGTLNGYQYFTTPGGCTDFSNPTCAGGVDVTMKKFAGQYGTSAYLVVTGATNISDGKAQSAMLATNYTDTEGAIYCENLDYAGYTDWYLPAIHELKLLYDNLGAHTGFSAGNTYITSSEVLVGIGSTNSWWLNFTSGQISNNVKKTAGFYVRCMRRF